MKTVNINGKDYHVKDHWSEYTYKEFSRCQKVCDQFPEYLKFMFNKDIKEQPTLTKTQELKEIPLHYGYLIEACSDIPEAVLNRVAGTDRSMIFWSLLSWVPFSIFSRFFYILDNGNIGAYIPNAKIKHIEKYKLLSGTQILGKDIPMADLQIKNFAEAADYEIAISEMPLTDALKYADGGNYDYLPMVAAIITTNPYNEAEVLKRKTLFEKVKMNVLLDVFFYSKAAKVLLLEGVRDCLAKLKLPTKEAKK